MMKQEDETIKVAQIIGKWIGGGVESIVMNYYKNIDHNKIQFDFFCDEDSTDIPYKEIEQLGGKVILIPPYQKIFKYHKELKKELIKGKYTIVHSHINTLSVFSLWAAKSAKVPVRIAHSHSTTNPKEKKKNMLKQLLKLFSKVFATDYFCCSEPAGRWLFGNKEYDKGNVFILNNAIDLDKFKYDEDIRKKKRKELKINEDTLVIGNVGRFVKQKNHEFLIDIFNEIYKQKKNSILLLVGQGKLQEKIKQKVELLGLKDNVKFLGQRKDVNELYQTFDVFLFPTLYEGLGMVLIEAQTSGLYCICSTEVPIIAKVTENFKYISLNEEISTWASMVLENDNFKNRKSYKQQIAKKGFDIRLEANKLVTKYEELEKRIYKNNCNKKY